MYLEANAVVAKQPFDIVRSGRIMSAEEQERRQTATHWRLVIRNEDDPDDVWTSGPMPEYVNKDLVLRLQDLIYLVIRASSVLVEAQPADDPEAIDAVC